eukprot:5857563-Amphidinium_carterae.1
MGHVQVLRDMIKAEQGSDAADANLQVFSSIVDFRDASRVRLCAINFARTIMSLSLRLLTKEVSLNVNTTNELPSRSHKLELGGSTPRRKTKWRFPFPRLGLALRSDFFSDLFHLEEQLKTFDKNCTGKLNKEELKEYLKSLNDNIEVAHLSKSYASKGVRCLTSEVPDEEVDWVMKEADVYADGEIGVGELVLATTC